MKKTKDEFKELIEYSGHNFHLEIVNLLKKNDWEVEISPYYYDDSAEKPREIDIIATKPVSISKDGDPSYNIFLFIECKHFDGEVVFWMDDVNKDRVATVIHDSITGLNIRREDTIQKNHYLKVSRVAKLFETKQKERKSNQDVIFNAFTQSIKSLIFYKKNNYNASGIYYPIVVYEPKDKVAVYSESDENKYKILNEREIILEVNYSFKNEMDSIVVGKSQFISRQNFFVDFIAKNDFEGFLNIALREEIEEINRILQFKIKHSNV